MNGKNRNRKIALFFIPYFIIVFTYGCAGERIKHFNRPGTDIKDIRKIAVLPFENLTAGANAHEKIRSLCNMDLLSRGVDVIEPGEVISALKELKITSLRALKSEEIQNIGEALNADALMTGSVSSYDIVRGTSVSYPEVSVDMMLYETKTGGIIWSVWHTSGGADYWTRHFGTESAPLEETSKRVVKEAIDTLF